MAVVASTWAGVAYGRARRARLEHQAKARGRYAEGAAWEAALDDPAFAPARLRATVGDIVGLAEQLWDGPRPSLLADRPDGWLIATWARTKAEVWGRGLCAEERPDVTPLRVVNREGEDEDRVVLRVRLKVRRERSKPQFLGDLTPLEEPTTVKIDERWTFGRRGETWYLVSVDGDPLAGPVLSAPLIPTPAADDARLTESSLRELGEADAVPGERAAELVSPSAPPGLALLDLSVVDGRFMPALLGAALSRLVETWETATTGSDAPLRALATPDAVTSLLRPAHGGDARRLVLQDAELVRWEMQAFDPAATPPRVVIDVTVRATYHLLDDHGDRLAGSPAARTELRPAWTLELDDDAPAEWRLVASSNVAKKSD